MKLIYSQIKYIACFALVFGAMHSVKAQCPPQSQQVCVTYTSGSFNTENSWLLYDASAGVELACDGTSPTVGTTMACVPSGNTVELYAYETFGDSWNGATLALDMCEDGSNNGCDAQGQQLLAATGNPGGASGNATAPCGSDMTGTGALAWSGVINEQGAGCIQCITCPADITVNNDPGVCGAFVNVPLPTDNGCGLGGVAVGCTTVDGPQANLQGAGSLSDTEFTIPGVSAIPASALCVAEVCIDFTISGDFSFAGEMTDIQDENGNVIGQNTIPGDCQPASTFQICVPVVDWNGWAADGTATFTLMADSDINPALCTDNFIQASVELCTDCEIFSNNQNMMGAASGDYPVGTTDVTYFTSLAGAPLSCSFSVTVNDNEAPVLNCPVSTTISLDAGECSAVYYYATEASDNCGLAAIPVGDPVDVGGVFGGLDDCPGQGSSLSCGTGRTSQNQELDITSLPANVQITEGCFIFDNTSWGNNEATINFYIDVPGLAAAGSPLPCYKTGTPVGTTGLVTLPAANAGVAVCIPVTVPFAVDATSDGLYMEVETIGGGVAFNGPSCNGVAADGTNTFLCSDGCGDGYFSAFGFNAIDAFFAFKAQEITFTAPNGGGPGTGVNEYASGDEIPYSEDPTCFSFTAEDLAGNTTTCDWCVTVSQFPEDKQTTTLSCNDLVNISVDEACEAVITPDVILEGGPYGCYETYNVSIAGMPATAVTGNGTESVAIDASRIAAFQANGMAGTYEVSIIDPDNNNNSCWGYIMLEDKLAPTITCEDVTISCIASTEPADPVTGSVSADNNDTGVQWADNQTGMVGAAEVMVDAPVGAKITDVNVSVSLDHSWSSDLTVTLVSPEGNEVVLAQGQCGSNDNWNVTFDSDASGAIACNACSTTSAAHEDCNDPALNETCAAVSGTVKPQGDLADLNGAKATGMWQVTVTDGVGGDGGCLHSVGLEVAYAVGAATPAVALDNCASIDPIYSDVVIDQDCSTGIDKIVVRTWAASDAKGNTATNCVQRITVESITTDEVPLPAEVVELPCGSDITPEAIVAYYDNPLTKDNNKTAIIENNEGIVWAYPYYLAAGHPQRIPDNGLCGIYTDYDDHVINACGAGCYGNKKVIRTWTILNWCTGDYDEYKQIIKAKDIVAPTFNLKDTIVSTRPWDCTAEFMLPEPWELHDDCDIAPGYYVTGPAGVVITPKPEGGYMAVGAPKGKHTFYYTAYDCCGNERTQAVDIAVLDKVAPVVTTDQDIVVSLTPNYPNGGQAKLFTHHIDNGSFDVCTDTHIEIRRADGAPQCGNDGLLQGNQPYNNNLTFNNTDVRFATGNHPNDNRFDTDGGQFVKFCCEDIDAEVVDANGDGVIDSLDRGYVMVIIRVWDDANMSGVYGDEVEPFPGCAPQRDNYNEGWAYVKVEDKLPPVISCPADATIYCDWGIDVSADFGNGFQNTNQANFDKTGVAEAYSTCGAVDVFFNDNINVNDCGVGTIIRQFQASTDTKTGTKTVTCQQVITVLERPTQFSVSPPNPNPLSVGCTLTQEDLNKRLPSVTGGACDVIGENVKVDTFLFENGVCKKWVAEYNYMNWCTGESMGPFYAYFVYEDTEKPVLDDCEDKMFGVDANCEHVLTLTNSATDGGGCTDEGWLKWQLFVDTWADGNINHFASSFVSPTAFRNWKPVPGNDPILPGGHTYADVVYVKYIEPTSSMGNDEVSVTLDAEVITGKMSNHKVHWKVTDGCHNHSTCSYDVMVADKKAPTPYCVSLSSALMENGGVELWARDFDKGSFDNCCAQEELLFTFYEERGAFQDTIIRVGNTDYLVNATTPQFFDENGFVDFDGDGVTYPKAKTGTITKYNNGDIQKWVPEFKSSAKVFDCDEFGAQGPNGVAVQMSVWDTKMNTDFCVVYLSLVDNQGACDPGSRMSIAGNVADEAGNDLADVEVTVEGSINDLVKAQTTTGSYVFTDLPMNVDYTVTADKDVDYTNGISTLDLVLIQRHILDIQKLDTPLKWISADVTNDGNIRASDLVELRKLILGVTNDFTAPSWKAVDADQTIAMSTPLNYDMTINVNDLTSDVTNANFVATKIGDVSGDAAANLRSTAVDSRSNKTVNLVVEEQEVVAGQTVAVDVTSANFADVYGYQFTTNLNGLNYNGVRSGAITMLDENVGVISNEVITTSWASTEMASVNADQVLFTLEFVATKSGKLSSMLNINSNVTKAEAYTDAEMNVANIDVTFRTNNTEVAVNALYQNEPNPFSDVTTVAYELANAGDVTFTLYDVTGKVVLVKDVEGVKGFNTVTFTTADMKVSGIVYYQIESGDYTATKKMMIIE